VERRRNQERRGEWEIEVSFGRRDAQGRVRKGMGRERERTILEESGLQEYRG